jgi:hypothetical protein
VSVYSVFLIAALLGRAHSGDKEYFVIEQWTLSVAEFDLLTTNSMEHSS